MNTLLVVGTILVLACCIRGTYGDVTTAKPKSQNPDYLSMLEKGIEILLNNVSATQGLSQLSNLTALFPAMNVQNVIKILQNLNVPIPSGSQINGALKLLNNLNTTFQSEQGYYKALTPACSSAMGVLGSQLMDQKQWALGMIDSWGKPRTGLFQGNVHWRGMYDECMNIVAEVNGEIAFEPDFCAANIPTPISGPTGKVDIMMWMCLPSVCTGWDPTLIANSSVDEAEYAYRSSIPGLIPLTQDSRNPSNGSVSFDNGHITPDYRRL